MNRLQNDLDTNHAALNIEILGVNGWGHESSNGAMTADNDLPLLQDVDETGDNLSDVWTSWDVAYRDVVVVDAESEVVSVYNLTIHDLQVEANYNELKDILIDAATPAFELGDCNQDGSLDSADLDCVSTAEERDAVLDSLNTLTGDLDGDGVVGFEDFLTLSTNFGNDSATYAQGNIDMRVGVDFKDFLILANHFGKTVQAAAPITAVDAAISDWGDLDDDDDDDEV